MSSQMYTQPESKNWFTAWAASRQTPTHARTTAPKGQTAPPAMRAEEMSAQPESQKAEDWAGDCLFDCYND